jgi:hypothetical protein
MKITETKMRIGRDCEMIRRFAVQRNAMSSAHVVEVEVSGGSGTPQRETCDCKGFQYRRNCSHIKAVYEAGLLFADCEG